MSRFALTATAVAVAAVVVGLAVALTRPAPQTGAQSTPAAHSPAATNGIVHDTAIGALVAGQTYRASTFSTPYTFTVPAQPASLLGGNGMTGDALDAAHALRISPGQGALTFQDGVGRPLDLCHPGSGVLTPLSGTPQSVGDWLAATKGLTITRRPDISLSSGTAMSWDVALASTCYSGDGTFSSPAPVVWFQAKEHHRVYAVPTPSGTMLILTWGNGYRGEGEDVLPAVNAWTDQLVKTIRFG